MNQIFTWCLDIYTKSGIPVALLVVYGPNVHGQDNEILKFPLQVNTNVCE